jgi:predicted ABC-type ATPase
MKGVDAFNVDDRAAQLYAQSLGRGTPIYVDIPPSIRELARSAMRDFIDEHLEQRRSFAFETTLRDVTFEQTRKASELGFDVQMAFIAAGSVEEHIARVSNRAEMAGHSAPPDALREIYTRAMGHLLDAFRACRNGEIESLNVFHNPRTAGVPANPVRIIGVVAGRVSFLAPTAPDWFHDATRGTGFEFSKLQALTATALL